MLETKQVIVVRKDLNMRKGKIAAQVAHASMKVILNLMQEQAQGKLVTKTLSYPEGSAIDRWLSGTFTKVCVSVNSEEELLDLYTKAKDHGILASLIQDSGKTEFHGNPTYTTVAIGPDYCEVIDRLTGELPLL